MPDVRLRGERLTDFEKNKEDTFYNLPPANGTFTLTAKKGDGWCVDDIKYIWPGHQAHVSAGLCNKVWLDEPCSKTAYDGIACAKEIVIDVSTGTVQKRYKDGHGLQNLC